MPSAPSATPYGQVAPQLRVGDALSFGWAKYKQSWPAWVLFVLVFAVVSALLFAPLAGDLVDWTRRLGDEMRDAGSTSFEVTDFRFSGGAIALAVVASLLALVARAMAWGAALREADGARVSLGQFFTARRLGAAVLAGLVIIVGDGIAGWIPLGSIAWQVFTVFTLAFVIDHGRPVFGAIGDSFRLVGKNFGAVFVLLIALVGINILGAIPVGLGLLVTLPLSVLALAYAFRRLTGGTIV
ncbi:hypothetical protein [Xylanimonas protaetiae]|uniref:Uncharacterized protein n=1 Tax=Xylanimonas protaetiae TaxID=2509457 RepID=A0A4P6F7P9_9MICO|nr:hypothetical protein [Xylanimonas protaetiae]QAY71486.1 hypothetical protein ET471_16830 [Xylanimonas protaetiae]